MKQEDYNQLFLAALKAEIRADQESFIVTDDEISEGEQQEMLANVNAEIASLDCLGDCVMYLEEELGAEDKFDIAEYMQAIAFKLAVVQGWVAEE